MAVLASGLPLHDPDAELRSAGRGGSFAAAVGWIESRIHETAIVISSTALRWPAMALPVGPSVRRDHECLASPAI